MGRESFLADTRKSDTWLVGLLSWETLAVKYCATGGLLGR